jgi:hypothetical protein
MMTPSLCKMIPSADPDIEEFLGNEGTTSHDLEREVPLHHPEMSGRYH